MLNYESVGGVNFKKGCYPGQEVVARMQHKTVVRKRVVPVTADGSLVEGAEVRVGEANIGRVGSVNGSQALALVRLDRAAEARGKGQSLMGDGVAIQVDPTALDAFAEAVAARTADGG